MIDTMMVSRLGSINKSKEQEQREQNIELVMR